MYRTQKRIGKLYKMSQKSMCTRVWHSMGFECRHSVTEDAILIVLFGQQAHMGVLTILIEVRHTTKRKYRDKFQ